MSKNATNSESKSLKEERYSIVEINGTLFGIEILKSREVFPLPKITPVPNTKSSVVGVFNLRGEIHPLFDISSVLGMAGKALQDTDMIVLLEKDETVMGILADRVYGVRIVGDEMIKPAQGSIPRAMVDYVKGMISDKSTEIFLLNVDRIISAIFESQFGYN
ncbi:MAG: purine-binding chemotaxis protein CheW [Calditrichaeota bacterium]|nr:purine-binding chemotaxis protein CheW [Calditrichota bacterium]RQV93030.1 MAG: purine-binding chemotaxis protein CheW [bacterium]RQW03882.1 MAG: purine-binding chemotaxis protein CheW [Calditrichota bacterium]